MKTETIPEIVTTRVIPFPREAVFDAWTDPKKLAQWWGPNGFTMTLEEYDLRPGGLWRFVLHGPDGANYPNKIAFEEIVAPEKVVFQHQSLPHFQVTATFEERGARTQVTFRMLFETEAECEKLKKICVEANEQNFDRLEAILRRLGGSHRDAAVDFLMLSSSGKVDAAYERYVAPNFIHHNAHYPGDRMSLKRGMKENAAKMPNKIFEIKRSLEDGDLVATHSHFRPNEKDPGVAVVHIFRFEKGKIAELWDLGQPVAKDSPNKNGMF